MADYIFDDDEDDAETPTASTSPSHDDEEDPDSESEVNLPSLSDFQHKFNCLYVKFADIKQQLKDAKTFIVTLEDRHKLNHIAFADHLEKHATVVSELEDTKTKLHKQQSDNSELQDSLSSLKAKFHELNEQSSGYECKYNEISEERVRLFSKIKTLEDELSKREQTRQTFFMNQPKTNDFYNPTKGLGFENPKVLTKVLNTLPSMYDINYMGLRYEPFFVKASHQELEHEGERREMMNGTTFNYDELNYKQINEPPKDHEYYQMYSSDKLDSHLSSSSNVYVPPIFLKKKIQELNMELKSLRDNNSSHEKKTDNSQSKDAQLNKHYNVKGKGILEVPIHVPQESSSKTGTSKIPASIPSTSKTVHETRANKRNSFMTDNGPVSSERSRYKERRKTYQDFVNPNVDRSFVKKPKNGNFVNAPCNLKYVIRKPSVAKTRDISCNDKSTRVYVPALSKNVSYYLKAVPKHIPRSKWMTSKDITPVVKYVQKSETNRKLTSDVNTQNPVTDNKVVSKKKNKRKRNKKTVPKAKSDKNQIKERKPHTANPQGPKQKWVPISVNLVLQKQETHSANDCPTVEDKDTPTDKFELPKLAELLENI